MAERFIQCSLHWSEILAAAQRGVLRKVLQMRAGQGHSLLNKPNKWWREIEGSCGELALAKATRSFWSGPIGLDAADRVMAKRYDVGQVQVRTRTDPALIIDQRDNPDDIFILVMGETPHFRIMGWIEAREAQQEKYWCSEMPHPNFKVPLADLHEMDELDWGMLLPPETSDRSGFCKKDGHGKYRADQCPVCGSGE